MKTHKLRIKRKVVVKSRKGGKLNRKISYRRKQRKSMVRRQKRNSRNNLKKKFSRKISRGGDGREEEGDPSYVSFSSLHNTGRTLPYPTSEDKLSVFETISKNQLPPQSDGRRSRGFITRLMNWS